MKVRETWLEFTAPFSLQEKILQRVIFRKQNFTDSEQSCIDRKVSVLRSEGKAVDQAIAQAISQCAPDKAES